MYYRSGRGKSGKAVLEINLKCYLFAWQIKVKIAWIPDFSHSTPIRSLSSCTHTPSVTSDVTDSEPYILVLPYMICLSDTLNNVSVVPWKGQNTESALSTKLDLNRSLFIRGPLSTLIGLVGTSQSPSEWYEALWPLQPPAKGVETG